MGRVVKAKVVSDLPLNDEYKVKFLWQESTYLDSQEIPVTEEESLLNIFKRTALNKAGFKQVGRGYFYRDSDNPPHRAMKKQVVNADASVLMLSVF